MRQITPADLQAWLLDPGRPAPELLDVREPWELAICVLPGSVHIPMRQIPAGMARLDPSRETVVVCHHGARSMQVAGFLESNGFVNVSNLAGGLAAWASSVDVEMASY